MDILDSNNNKKDTTRMSEGVLREFTDKKHRLNKGDRKNKRNKI